MRALVVIPARWASSRFPGKPLALVAGRPLLVRAIDLARRATAEVQGIEVMVATDDQRVADLAATTGTRAVLTSAAISSGTGRALAAARTVTPQPAAIVNLQGDAPFLPPSAVRDVLTALAAGAAVATPVVPLSWTGLDALRRHKQRSPFSGTTCVRGQDGDALWFSKQILPAIRDEAALRGKTAISPVYRHLGLYGYTLEALERFEAAPPSRYERLEGLEQLRYLELGLRIRTVIAPEQQIAMGGIDTPADLELAEALIAQHGDPFGQ